MSLKHAPISEMERPLKTYRRRAAIRDKETVIPQVKKNIARAGNKWGFYAMLARFEGEETLIVNQKALSIKHARALITRHNDVVPLEIRQQPIQFCSTTDADRWWETRQF